MYSKIKASELSDLLGTLRTLNKEISLLNSELSTQKITCSRLRNQNILLIKEVEKLKKSKLTRKLPPAVPFNKPTRKFPPTVPLTDNLYTLRVPHPIVSNTSTNEFDYAAKGCDDNISPFDLEPLSTQDSLSMHERDAFEEDDLYSIIMSSEISDTEGCYLDIFEEMDQDTSDQANASNVDGDSFPYVF